MAISTRDGLSVALVGDFNLGTPINPHNVLDLIKTDFAAFDITFCNLEGCLFDPNVLLEHKPGWRHCDQAHVQVLAELKLNAAACANNVHFGEAAITHSLSGKARWPSPRRSPQIRLRPSVRAARMGGTCGSYGPRRRAAGRK